MSKDISSYEFPCLCVCIWQSTLTFQRLWAHSCLLREYLSRLSRLLEVDCSRSNRRFDELHRLLLRAVEGKKLVAIGVLPAGNLVEDVRVDDWQG